MTNKERGEYMFNDARMHLEHMLHAYKKRRWNIVVREAQEVVELSLKGILKLMCIEYPKVHDVAETVMNELKNKGIKLSEDITNKIIRVSGNLARNRAPAFYGEKIYTQEQAKEAKESAEWISKVIKDLRKTLE